ncbi:glycosyltransferase family 2 protein, partial [Vibrio rarus]
SYNSATTIDKSIESVLSQSYANWELIIIDDYSTDNTVELVNTFSDKRIKCIELDVNSGSPAKPRNIGIDHAKGDYIAFLDSDDIWCNNKLETQINLMVQNDISFTCSGYRLVKSGIVISSYVPPKEVTYKDLLTNNSVGCLTAMVRKDLLGDLRFPICGHEDFALWLKLVKKSKIIYGMQQNLADYNLIEGSVSSSKFKLIPFFWNIYRNEEKLSISLSLYYCIGYLINVILFKYKKTSNTNRTK